MNYDPPEIGSYEHRFSGIQRLYGYDSSILLKSAHFVVIGLGVLDHGQLKQLHEVELGK